MNDGGPAFPTATTGTWSGIGDGVVFAPDVVGGMSLRDYFAGQALIGKSHWRAMKTIEEQELAADECYSIADAMIAARTKNLTTASTTE